MEHLYGTVNEVLTLTWPMLFISLVLVTTLRVSYIIKNNVDFVLYEEIMLLAFMLYILVLFQLVTAQDLNSFYGTNNFVPFTEIFRYSLGSRLFYKNIIGNVLLFVPYGLFASIYLKLKKPAEALAIAFIASLAIESTQFMIGRVFDVDDILLNVLGGLTGYFIYRLFNNLVRRVPALKSKLFLNIITLIMFIFVLIFMLWRIL